jgi:hypothetical protein
MTNKTIIHKIEKLLEEAFNAEEAVKMKIDTTKLKKLLPKQYQKLFENFLTYDPRMKYTLEDFYKVMSKNAYDIYDYIPLGYDNAEYLVYHIPTRKVYGLSHESKTTESKPGYNIKNDYAAWAEHLQQSLATNKKLFEKYSPSQITQLEKDLSKYLGFKVKVDQNDYQNKDQFVSVYASKTQDELDNFGSKPVYQKLMNFKDR